MTITKRHYETIAKSIRANRDTLIDTGSTSTETVAGIKAIRLVAEGLANIFAADNPRFHRSRFLDACGFIVDYTDPPAAPWQGDPTLGGRRERKRRAYVPSWQRETQG